ncbi:MAG: hypothetical protein DRO36_01075 [Candidatus Hecatellales archaeon]|nr:MAG: hypothetical protein DRO36_01075 [Candidatus Hecatellales archaeon]
MQRLKCCRSCVYWDFASKKVPVDVRKKPLKNEFLEVSFENHSVKIPAWEWKTVKPIKLSEILRRRVCFYGKGVVEPWDECENYKPKFEDGRVACQLENVGCEYSDVCPKNPSRKRYTV